MDVFDLVAKIRVDSSEYEREVGKAKGSFSKFASGIGKGLATVAKVSAAAITAAAGGIAALTKMGVESYAQYEQLVGGVETLFKTSQDTVMRYAENAYKTAGMSANEYMQTVTSFSASLIQSLDGDTAKAAEVGNMAITDMSDNANKMGTSMEMIQNAYNGFAKQNYTMLDNLKLGYGGTKTEMQRLLKDAQKLSGIKYDISSYSDVIEAIHVIQTEMGITGTTAAEAASTIEGSMSMMKASWQNLVTGMADENANMSVLISNFVDSTATAVGNLIPRIEQILAGVGQLVQGLAPVIAEALPGLVTTVLPSILNAAVGMFNAVVAALPSLVSTVVGALPGILNTALPVVIQAAIDIIMAFLGVITENMGLFLQTGLDAILQLVTGITQALPQIIESAVSIITELVSTLTSQENLQRILDAALLLIETVIIGLINNLPQLVDAAIMLVQNLVDFITEDGNLEKLLDMAVYLITTIIDGLVSALPKLVDAAIKVITQLVHFLLQPENIAMLLKAALNIIMAIVNGLIAATGELTRGALELISALGDEFSNADWVGIGKTIIDSLLDGLKAAWESVSTWFSSVWNSLFDRDVNVSADSNGNVNVKGYATGLNYVPYDEFPALLHRGEAVLTAAEARAWRKNGLGGATPAMSGGITINQYIQSVPQTPAEVAAATEAYFEQARWML